MTAIGDGTVQAVNAQAIGDELAVAAIVGATVLTVDDAADFAEDGGVLRVGNAEASELVTYTACDDASSTITLATGLVSAWPVGTRVELWDSRAGTVYVQYLAQVSLSGDIDNDDTVQAVVQHALAALLPEGIRAPGQAESVIIELIGSQWYVTNVVGQQPALRGELINPGSVPRTALSFTVGSTTATVGTAPTDPATNDVWFDSANGYQMKTWSGSAWVAVAFGTAAIAAGAITADLIAAGAIVAGKIAVGALDALTINAGALTAGVLSSGAIGSSSILDSFISTTRFTVDTSGGQILVYSMGAPVVTTITTTGAGSYTVPAGVTSLKVEAWGPGAGGAGGLGTPNSLGGGGGEYACEPAFAVTPGSVHSYVVGAGGAGGAPNTYGDPGGFTAFDTDAVRAYGGAYYLGGANSVDSLHFSGGSSANSVSFAPGNGGGGSGGTATVGNNGRAATSSSVAGAGGAAVPGGGAGGAGGAGTASGVAGSAPGGGGGGGGGTAPGHNGGAGARGQLRITYVPARALVATIAGVAGTDAYGLTYPVGVKVQRPDLIGVIGGYYRAASFSQTVAATTTAALTALTTIKELSDLASSPWTGAVFTAPADGIYTAWLFGRHVIASVGPDVYITVNGTVKARTNATSGSATSQAAAVLANYWLNAGDTIGFTIVNNASSSTAFQGNVTVKKEA
jgi:hypothetical protein